MEELFEEVLENLAYYYTEAKMREYVDMIPDEVQQKAEELCEKFRKHFKEIYETRESIII